MNEQLPAVLRHWHDELSETLGGLREKSLLRTLRTHHGLVDFCSNDYLSLNSTGELYGILEGIIRRHEPFIGSTGSRLIRGHYEFFERAEAAFADFTGFPSALLFQSGYQANVGVLSALLHRNDTVLCDSLIHASLIDGVRLSGAKRLSYRHNDLDDLAQRLGRLPPGRGRRWIVSETLFSMDGDIPDLPALINLASRFGALLVLDEAHAIGACGPNGAGLIAEHRLQNQTAVAIYPCGKAPGVSGAFVCGAAAVRAVLINRARSFVFSTAQSPLLADLLECVIRQMAHYEDRRTLLRANATLLRSELSAAGFDVRGANQIVPVMLGTEVRALHAAGACTEAGFDVRAIRPPSVPPGTSRLRLTVHADHVESELRALVGTLAQSLESPPKNGSPPRHPRT